MRVLLKSPVRENRTPGSVRGQSGNRLSYRDDFFIMRMRRRTKASVILATLGVWLVGTIIYAYQWVVSALAEPGIASYENNVIFPLSAFVV